ncbi:DUF6504 family protein [Nocardioides plantarum]|uniref:DUF6504 family protein n=1 Tax=Nocardioides plantarum TaxID=29299 RepID=A0ABV5KGF8_9ACTN|nr:DUF6504 family protein [Nocardioides plantarum]
MRHYDDPVEVRRGAPDDERGPERLPGPSPEQFLWRGRLWKVRAVVAHWVETGSWRQGDEGRGVLDADGPTVGARAGRGTAVAAAPVVDLLPERELWRVQAGRGGLESDGVFDLSFDGSDGSWSLVGCQD